MGFEIRPDPPDAPASADLLQPRRGVRRWSLVLGLGLLLVLPVVLHPILPGLIDGLLGTAVIVGLFPLYIFGFFGRNDLGEHSLLLGVWTALNLLVLSWSRSQDPSRTRFFMLCGCGIAILVSWVGQVRVLDANSILFVSTKLPAAIAFALTGGLVGVCYILRMLFEDLEASGDY